MSVPSAKAPVRVRVFFLLMAMLNVAVAVSCGNFFLWLLSMGVAGLSCWAFIYASEGEP